MNYFRIILASIRVVIVILFTANIIFMVQLYDSIKARCLDDVQQSLRRADQIEIVDRIITSGLSENDKEVWLQFGLQKSDSDVESTYSQGYRRIDTQIISEISRFLHSFYGDRLGNPNISNMEDAFRRDLNYSGYYPEYIKIVDSEDLTTPGNSLWELEYRVDNRPVYHAYISPLTKHILREMSGVIITSALIAIVLITSFGYLLYVINRLKTIEEMKDDFTNNMTHELKTPIAIAYAANDSLLQFPDSANSERTKKYLTAALDQLSKLSGLVETILAISMERRKNLTMARERINLKVFLTSITEQHKIRTGKIINISVDCIENEYIYADPTHFYNIMSNLIDNSIKYSGDSVSIVITADSYSLSVSDNGIGIPEKFLPEIFNRFYRVPNSHRSKIRGYGIGLYYVKTIVDKHGWDICVESKSGKGSMFTITFKKA